MGSICAAGRGGRAEGEGELGLGGAWRFANGGGRRGMGEAVGGLCVNKKVLG